MSVSEGSTIAKFTIPIIMGVLVAVGLTTWGRGLDSSDKRDGETKKSLEALTLSVTKLTTDVAVIKAVVVDSQLARRVGDLEAEVKLIKEKLPK